MTEPGSAAAREALRKAVRDALDAGVPLEDIDGIVYLATLHDEGEAPDD